MDDLITTQKHRDLIYDIGMHRGEDSEFYLRKGFRVVGFEANPDMAALCRARLKEFIDRKKLIIVEGAILSPEEIASGMKEVTFYKYDDFTQWSTTQKFWTDQKASFQQAFSAITVPAVDFEQAIREHGMPHYMKIDIEGSDMIPVNALRRFKERPNYLSIEADYICLANVKEEIDNLISLGYKSFKIVDQSALPKTHVPPNPPREGEYAEHRFEFGSSGLFGAELPGDWKDKRAFMREYRVVMLGLYLMGSDGIMRKWKFPGAEKLQRLVQNFFFPLKGDLWPAWHDTHARLEAADNAR